MWCRIELSKGYVVTGIYDFSAQALQGGEVSLESYRDKVVLVVNTASKCGFTSQYQGLEAMYKELAPQGFEVLGFPCNQFGSQEPGDASEIGSFCERNFGVSFPLFAKVDVNGDEQHPLFRHLKREAPGVLGTQGIKWNFTKFLVGRDGEVVRRFGPRDKPEVIAKAVVALL